MLGRMLVAGVVAGFAVLGGASAAWADTLSVSVSPSTVAGGQSATVTVSGQDTSGSPVDVYVVPASAGCAADDAAASQRGDVLLNAFFNLPAGSYDSSAQASADIGGRFGQSSPNEFSGPAGNYVLCGYLYNGNTYPTTTVAEGSTLLTLRSPNDSISVAPKFTTPASAYYLNIPVGYHVEPGTAPVTLALAFYPKFYIEGGPTGCNDTPVTKSVNLRSGDGSVSFRVPLNGRGAYGMCATMYIGSDYVVAKASATIIAVAGTGCVVPKLAGTRLAVARNVLSAAHCRLGGVKRRRHRGTRRGTVLSQSVPPGRRLPPGTAVNVVVAK